MILKSFGCSFIYGSDLPDCSEGPDERDLRPSMLTWPALVAQKKGMKYKSQAWPGTGNLRILERISFEIDKSDRDSLFVVSWTWIDRLDYVNQPENIYKSWGWQSVMPGEDTAFARDYYRTYHNQFKDQFTSAVYIKQAIELLQNKRIPFLMTYQDDLILDRSHNHPGLTDIQNFIKPHLQTFQEQTFLEWSLDRGYPISKGWHPLEEAHLVAADYVLDHWSGLV